jgi:hypothetical protein
LASDRTGKLLLLYVILKYRFHTVSFYKYQPCVIHFVFDLKQRADGLRHGILRAVSIKAAVFWDVKLCNLAHGYPKMEAVYLSESLAPLTIHIQKHRSLTGSAVRSL